MYLILLITDYVALLLVAACIFFISIQKSSYAQKLMSNISFWCCCVLFGFCIKITYSSLDAIVIGQKIIYMTILHCLFYMLLFVINYCRLDMPNIAKAILVINNVIMSIVVYFADKNDLFYSSLWYEEVNGIPVLRKSYGPAHTLYLVEMSLYFISMCIIVAIYVIRTKKSEKKSSFLMILAIFIPCSSYFMQKILNSIYEFEPLGIFFSTLIMLYLIYVERIYDLSDSARDYIFDAIDSAIIVTDENYKFKSCNNLAVMIFPELTTISTDDGVYGSCASLRQIINGNMNTINHNGNVYEPSIKRVEKNNACIGIIIWLKDVTTQFEYKALQDSYRKELEAEVEKQTNFARKRSEKIEQMSMQMVQTLANTIDAKDKYTNGHSTRVAEYSVRLAKALDWDKETLDMLRYEGLLHDIGKIGIPDTILNKPSKLTDSEFNVIQSHTIMGGNIMMDTSTLPGAENVIRHHHEKYDGSGYPLHLKGNQIPLDARIVGIADAYDAMSSNRIYRKALPKDTIRREMLKGSGKQFDPELLDIFIKMFDNGELDDVAPKDNGWDVNND